MTTSASFDEALGTLATAIEDILDLLAPSSTAAPASAPEPAPAPEPVPEPEPEPVLAPAPPTAPSRCEPDAPEWTVPVLHLDPGIDPNALVHALRHALHR